MKCRKHSWSHSPNRRAFRCSRLEASHWCDAGAASGAESPTPEYKRYEKPTGRDPWALRIYVRALVAHLKSIRVHVGRRDVAIGRSIEDRYARSIRDECGASLYDQLWAARSNAA